MIYIPSKQKKQGLAFLLLALISWAPHASANPADLETGRDIFYKHCKACHGDKGDGKTFAANVLNPPPKNFTVEELKKELTDGPIRYEREEGHRHDAVGIEPHPKRNPRCGALHPKKTDATGKVKGFPFYFFISFPSLFSMEAILDSSRPDLPSR